MVRRIVMKGERHAGRMDDPYYVNDFVRKINTYINNKLIPGKDFFITYETQNTPLDIGVIKQLMKEIESS